MISVLHIDTGMTFRGGQRQVTLLAKSLSKYNIRQYLAVPDESPLINLCRDYDIFHLPIGTTNIKRYFSRSLMRDFIRAHAINIIHAHDSHAHSMAVSLRFKTKAPKIIVTRRCPNAISFGSRKKYTKHNICFIAVSECIKSILADGGVRSEQIIHIPDMIESLEHRLIGPTNTGNQIIRHKIRLVSAGVFDEAKGFLTAIKAIEILAQKRRDFTYTIFGDGDTLKELKFYVLERGLSKFVHFPGWISDVYNYWNDADIFISPSHQEGLNSSLLEAMAIGLCPIVTDIPAHRENVTERETGLLFPIQDHIALSGQIEYLLENPNERTRISQRVKNAAIKYSPNCITKQTFNLYKRLVADVK